MEAWVELKNGADAADCSKLAPVQLISRESVRALNSFNLDAHMASGIPSDLSGPFRLDETLSQENPYEKCSSAAQ